MFVKITLPRFDGIADLTGAEMDSLVRIVAKLIGTDSQYLQAFGSVMVPNDEKARVEMTVDTTMTILSKDDYKAGREAQDRKDAAEEEIKKAARADAATACYNNCAPNEDVNALIKLLDDQGKLYYKEASRCEVVSSDDTGIVFHVIDSSGSLNKVIVALDGTFTRIRA
jgi:hypothetical protein